MLLGYSPTPTICNAHQFRQILKVDNPIKIKNPKITVDYKVETSLIIEGDNTSIRKKRRLNVGIDSWEADITEYQDGTIDSYQGRSLPREVYGCMIQKIPKKTLRKFLSNIEKAGYVEE